MATIRHHTHVNASPDDVWKVVSDSAGMPDYFPGVKSVVVDGNQRTVEFGGLELVEEIVTSDDEMRRFQYRIVGGPMVPEYHLGTIDVLPDGDGALLVYGTEVLPDAAKAMIDPTIAGAVAAIKAHVEK
jgi:hypothetical protein